MNLFLLLIKLFAGLFCFFIVSACTVGPNYQMPHVDLGQGWSSGVADTADASIDLWWASFNDPTLVMLIESARKQNLTLRQALSRIKQARAIRKSAASRYYPGIGAKGEFNRKHFSENGAIPLNNILGVDDPQTVYRLNFDVLWELDLFGRNRKRVEMADAYIDQANAEAADILLSVTAEVARNYLQLRGAQKQLISRNESVKAAETTFMLVQTQHNLGDVSAADVAIARAELAAQRADLPRLQSHIQSTALALGVLLGGLPEAYLHLSKDTPSFGQLTPIPVGKRADILRRRADVRIAERRLVAATAGVGLATAELFPKLVINVGGGFEALEMDDFFSSDSQQWNIGPLLSWRIFEGGRIRAEIQVSEAKAEQAVLAYEQSVIVALGEAEQAISQYQFSLERLDLQRISVDAASDSYRYASARYKVGDISLLELLDVQRTLNNAKQLYATVHASAAISLVVLYKALGGGWLVEST